MGQRFADAIVRLVEKGASPSPPDRPHTSQLDQQLPESVTHARTHVIIRHVIEPHVLGRIPDNLINNCRNPRHAHAQARHRPCPSCTRAGTSRLMPVMRSSSSVIVHALASLPIPASRLDTCYHPVSASRVMRTPTLDTRHAHTHARHTSCTGEGGHQSSPCTHTATRHHHTHTHRQRVRVKVVGLEDDCVVGYEINLVVGCVCCWFSIPRAQITSPRAQITSGKEA